MGFDGLFRLQRREVAAGEFDHDCAAPCHCSGSHRRGSPRRARAARARRRRSGRTGGSCIRAGCPAWPASARPRRRRCCRWSPTGSGSRPAGPRRRPNLPGARPTGSAASSRRALLSWYWVNDRSRCSRPKPRGLVSLNDEMARAAGIGQRPPDALAVAGQHEQAVGVVDLRAIVVARRRGLAGEEHRGQRRDRQQRHVMADEEHGLGLDDRPRARADDEGEGAGRGGRIEQCPDRRARWQLAAGFTSQNERKVGNSSGRSVAVSIGKAARRAAVALVAPDRPEIAGAEKGDHLVELVRPVERIGDLEARQRDILGRLLQAGVAEVELAAAER